MSETPTLQMFVEAWTLFREPALAGAVAGGLLGFLGVYIVLRRMVFLSAALSQSAGLGVTLAFYAQLHLGATGLVASPSTVAILTTLAAAAFLIGAERGATQARRDSLLGLVYLGGSAGALAIGTRIVQEVHDINTILFGSAVAVLPEDFRFILGMAGLLLVVHVWLHRGFILASFDRDGAQVRGLPVHALELILLLTMALAISICTRVLGALPVFAFTVLPAMAAVQLAANVKQSLLIASVLGAAAGLGGYVVAFLYELPVGASQTGMCIAGVVVSSLASRALKRRELRARVPVQSEAS